MSQLPPQWGPGTTILPYFMNRLTKIVCILPLFFYFICAIPLSSPLPLSVQDLMYYWYCSPHTFSFYSYLLQSSSIMILSKDNFFLLFLKLQLLSLIFVITPPFVIISLLYIFIIFYHVLCFYNEIGFSYFLILLLNLIFHAVNVVLLQYAIYLNSNISNRFFKLPNRTGLTVEETVKDETYIIVKETLEDLVTKNIFGDIYPGLMSIVREVYNVCTKHFPCLFLLYYLFNIVFDSAQTNHYFTMFFSRTPQPNFSKKTYSHSDR